MTPEQKRAALEVEARLTVEQHAAEVVALLRTVKYLAAQSDANGFPSDVARTLRDLCAIRADQLAMGHGMTAAQWDSILEAIDDI